MKTWLLLIVLAAHVHFLSAQTLPNRRYTTRDGLVADRITVITQDQDGFMWMGSLFGVSRYDGTRFTTINLPAEQRYKYVTSLLAADNKVYAGFLFDGGLMEYEKGRATAHFIHPYERGSGNDIVCLADDAQGILVVNSLNEVYRFDGSKFQLLFKSPQEISLLASDAGGRIWAATGNGLSVFDNGKLANVVKGQVLYLQPAGKGVKAVWSDSTKTQSGFISDHVSIKWQTAAVASIPFNSANADIYWGIDKHGLFNKDSLGRAEYYTSAVHPATEVKYLYADKENNLWLVSDPGVLKISNIPAISYQFDELAPGGSDVYQSNDSTVWCTNSKFLYRIIDNRLQKAEEFRSINDPNYIGSLMVDNNDNLWACGWNNGLWKLKYNGTKLLSKQYFNISANCLVKDGEGNIWAAGVNGIYHINNGIIKDHYLPKGKSGGTSFITAMAIDTANKELWLGENTSGVIRVDYKTYKVLDYFDEKNGLTDTYIRSLLFDSQKNIWVGTRLGGIFRMHRKNDGTYVAQHYNSGTCSRVTDISEEKGIAIWFATCDGMFQFSLASETWKSYNAGDGLLGSEVFSLAPGRQHVWAVSGQGLTNIRYAMQGDGPSPKANITQVTVLGKPDTSALFLTDPRKLSSSESSIGFSFAGASYTDERNVRYKYMLEGYDKDWSPPVQSNSVNYASLPFGHYTFKVLASNGEQWSAVPATFSFEVVRPFYKSYWFIALVCIVIAASFYFIRVYRLKQKLKVEKLRVNIARDLHDDIGSALGSINLLSENATRRLSTTRSVEEVAGVFQKIGYSAQSMLDSMDDIIWTINPEKDSMQDLLIRMREFAIPLLEAKNIRFDINMNASEGVRPSMEIKRNIYLVFKEAIFNVVRHSACTTVSINAVFTQRAFDISIADNGKGFNINTLSGRNGLKNMKKRADVSGASLRIDTAPGSGTTIHFHGIIR